MRFILQINLSSATTPKQDQFIPNWINELLPVTREGSSEGVIWNSFSYATDDVSIVEANWDQPVFTNEQYFLFIGGHVFFRITEADKRGRYIPTPEEVLSIIVEHGDNHYSILKGNYHFILYNKKNQLVTIYTSPLSLYPAWYYIQDGILYIGDLLESLLRNKKNLSINEQGLVEFTLFDHCLGAHTIYDEIFQLIGGACLTISQSEKKEKLVYDLSKWITKKPLSRKNSIDQINKTFKRHITEFINSVKHFNISLTGGFDGRLNFAFVDKADYPKLQAFSYGMKDSLQISIPKKISSQLNFKYTPVQLDEEFEQNYAKIGMEAILYSGGVTPFIRANYPYGYGKVNGFSRNCILGQCDVIRPLYTNPAGAIFNNFSYELFFSDNPADFFNACQKLSKEGFLKEELFSKEILEKIYDFVSRTYILPYPELNANEKYYLFLMKESMLKFWHTECHLVDLYVNDFISFSDLDYLETISKTEYFGLYKGIFASNQFQRRRGQDLYADLMQINNKKLNNIVVDRLFKPKWIRRSYLGYLMIAFGKVRVNMRKKRIGNDTFGSYWSELFYKQYNTEISKDNKYFNLNNLKSGKPYPDNNSHRLDRHISLKLWLQYIGLE